MVSSAKGCRRMEHLVLIVPTALGFFDFGSQPLRAGLSCGALLALSDGRGIRCEKRAAVASFCASRSPFGMTAFFL